jgi:hypothetical protein
MVATELAPQTRRSSDQKYMTILCVKKMTAKIFTQSAESKQVLAVGNVSIIDVADSCQ